MLMHILAIGTEISIFSTSPALKMSFKVWKPKLLKELKFDNIALHTLPVDCSKIPGSRKVCLV